jgi:hypothetical protein
VSVIFLPTQRLFTGKSAEYENPWTPVDDWRETAFGGPA